uniref:Uncharacterized protein n=1 Tax=Siphoviridae sp. ctNwR4 TaxID=2825474 RepID=A0A8S5P394_9CAUD|nr:MAG TPA: hypothetical protein [Siphoviridae sp. ctNwR4]
MKTPWPPEMLGPPLRLPTSFETTNSPRVSGSRTCQGPTG